MQISTQIFVEKHTIPQLSDERLRQKLSTAKRLANLQRLMIWADDDLEFYQRIIRLCKEYNIETYLWFNMLADIPGYEIHDEDVVVNYKGVRGNGQLGLWEKLGKGNEEFRFICPNNSAALNKVFHSFKTLADQVPFDGIFFDRIRYPSFTNGFESLFTCFCEFCQEKFVRRYGTSLDSYRTKINDLLERWQELSAGELAQHQHLETFWESAELEDFFEFRRASVYDAVQRFSNYAKSQSRQVGLDLFSPSLAPFVSQDYQRLSQCCDWIKPMSYCHVLGPAGVPLEISCLIRAMKTLCPRLNEGHITQFLSRVLGVTLSESAEAIRAQGIPEMFVARELEKIRGFSLPQNIRVHAGIEAVHYPLLDLVIHRETLERYLEHIGHNADGLVASWDILHIPDENFELLGQVKP